MRPLISTLVIMVAMLVMVLSSCVGSSHSWPSGVPSATPPAQKPSPTQKGGNTATTSGSSGLMPSSGVAPREALPSSLGGLTRTSPESRKDGAVAASYKGGAGQAEVSLRFYRSSAGKEPFSEAKEASLDAAKLLKGAELLSIQDVSFDCGGLIIEGIAYEYMGRATYSGSTRDLRLVVYLLYSGHDRALVVARYPEESLHEGRRSAERLIMALRWPLKF